MAKNQYISLILLMIILVTLVNLYYKPSLTDFHQTMDWLEKNINPIARSNCPLQGFKCPTSEPCDCTKFCNNAKDYMPFQVLDDDKHIYVMNKRLLPGAYCLPKGAGNCNLDTSYHIFSLAGWSCVPKNDVVFKRDKKNACKSEEAKDNSLNILWDYREMKEAEGNVEDYYERHGNSLRYQCKCQSLSLDETKMISVFPFICSVDYCLRDIPKPLPFMGWDGKKCECGTYFHLDPNDPLSPCRMEISNYIENTFTGRVECMSKNSFVKQPLICPTDDNVLIFEERMMGGDGDPCEYVQILLDKKYI